MRTIDERRLQRLVDGELDRETVRELLKSADANPELWRQMAVGFVEDQIWQAEFQSLEQEGPKVTLPADANAGRSPGRPPRRMGRWLMIAAGIMLGLTIGYLPRLVNQVDSPTSNQPALADADQAPEIDSVTPTQTTFRPDYHVNLNSRNGDSLLSSDVPLYKPSDLQRMGYDMMQPIEVNEGLADWLRESGYQLDQSVNFISGRLNDGRRFVVPIRTTKIHYGQ